MSLMLSVISVGASTIEASGSNIGGSVTESHVVHNGDLLRGSSVLSVGELQIKTHGYNVRFDHPLFTFRSTEVFGVDIHYRSELYPYMEKWHNSVLFLFTILVTSFSMKCFSITLSAITI